MNTRNLGVLDSPRFDWMQATVRDDANSIAQVLGVRLEADSLEPGKGLLGYRASWFVKRKGETLARVLFGGNESGGRAGGNPHVITTSAAVDEVAPVIRSQWAGIHEVTRLDSAQDFDSPEAFDAIRAMMLVQAESSGLSVVEMQSTRGGVLSRTVYLGSPSSRVRVRLYEKGAMEQQLGDASASSGWVRMEIQARPTGHDARVRATTLDPVEAWGLSPWTASLASRVMQLEVPRVTMHLKRDPDYARALLYLERQYGPTLRKALEVEGSWEAVGKLLGVLGSSGSGASSTASSPDAP